MTTSGSSPRPAPSRMGTGARPDGTSPPPQPTKEGAPSPLSWSEGGGPRIAFWGPTRSGKTTFLGALFVAVRRVQGFGSWTVLPLSEESKDYQDELSEALGSEKPRFPGDTPDIKASMSWRFSGDLTGTQLAQRPLPRDLPGHLRRRARPERDHVEFELQLQDLPGGVFDRKLAQWDHVRPELIKHLSQAHGFVYLHDHRQSRRDHGQVPPGDVTNAQAARMFRETVEELRYTLGVARLSQHVAVCVSKLDSPQVFTLARERKYVAETPRRESFGRMTPDNARRFFEWLCSRDPEEGLDLMSAALRTEFLPGRVSYYGTSAIGFLHDDQGNVDPQDYPNNIPPSKEIRGRVDPINVLEPLVRLAQDIQAATSGDGDGGR